MTETIVSMVPYPMKEGIASVYHPEVNIDAAKEGDIEIAYVEDTYCMIYLDRERGYLKRPISAAEFADALVRGFLGATICVLEDAQPGFFHVPGKLTKSEVLSKHKDLIKLSQDRQVRWYHTMVKEADDHWAKFRQHRMISDPQREAARRLGFEREWLVRELINTRCPACTSFNSPAAVVCLNCKCVLRPEEFKKLSFAT